MQQLCTQHAFWKHRVCGPGVLRGARRCLALGRCTPACAAWRTTMQVVCQLKSANPPASPFHPVQEQLPGDKRTLLFFVGETHMDTPRYSHGVRQAVMQFNATPGEWHYN